MSYLLLIISLNTGNVILAVPIQDRATCETERSLLKAGMRDNINWRVGCYDIAKQNFLD